MEKRLPNDEYRLNRAMDQIMEMSPHLDYSMLAEAAATAGRLFKAFMTSNEYSFRIIMALYETKGNSTLLKEPKGCGDQVEIYKSIRLPKQTVLDLYCFKKPRFKKKIRMQKLNFIKTS